MSGVSWILKNGSRRVFSVTATDNNTTLCLVDIDADVNYEEILHYFHLHKKEVIDTLLPEVKGSCFHDFKEEPESSGICDFTSREITRDQFTLLWSEHTRSGVESIIRKAQEASPFVSFRHITCVNREITEKPPA